MTNNLLVNETGLMKALRAERGHHKAAQKELDRVKSLHAQLFDENRHLKEKVEAQERELQELKRKVKNQARIMHTLNETNSALALALKERITNE